MAFWWPKANTYKKKKTSPKIFTTFCGPVRAATKLVSRELARLAHALNANNYFFVFLKKKKKKKVVVR